MGLKEFQIVLDNPVCHPGQKITGKLLVELKKPKKIKGLYVKYFGKGIVQWNEGLGTTIVTHSNAEVYLMLCDLVFGNGTDECELSEGRHVFDFSCQLPTQLPCSFEGLYGRIRYSVRAMIDEPWKTEYVAKQSMTIMSIFNLNYCPLSSLPVQERNSKIFWGQSKPLFMSVHIPIRGFIPGQIIPIKVILNNESEVQVKRLEVTLKQNVVFHAPLKSTPMKSCLLRSETPVEGGFRCHEKILNLQIPVLPSSYLEFCKIMDLRYQLNVKAKVTGCHKSLKVSTEIIIGHIPVVGYELPVLSQDLLSNTPINPGDLHRSQDLPPPPYTGAIPLPIGYVGSPPPPYEQITRFGNTEELDEVRRFFPLYPVHNFGTSKT